MPLKCLKNASKMPQKCLKNASKMPQKCLKNASKMPTRIPSKMPSLCALVLAYLGDMKQIVLFLLSCPPRKPKLRCHDAQHNDTQHNDIHHNDTPA
jgi:hypothetical protein